MTEKRFEIIELEEEVYPLVLFLDNGKEMTDFNVVECLNALHEENQQYKILVKSLKEQNQKLKLRLKDLGVEYL